MARIPFEWSGPPLRHDDVSDFAIGVFVLAVVIEVEVVVVAAHVEVEAVVGGAGEVVVVAAGVAGDTSVCRGREEEGEALG